MKLTNNQQDHLSILKEEKSVSINSSKVNKNTMNSIAIKGLVTLRRCANGQFWELTDSGYVLSQK